MCAPMALMGASMAISAAGSAYQASQENAAGKAEQNFYNAQADASKQQAEFARQTGEQRDTLAQDQGMMNARIVSRQYAVLTAAAKAALAANGQGGSVGEENIIGDTLDKRALDEATISYNANARSWEAKQNASYESWADLTQANQYTAAGINARRAAAARANSTLLSGAGQVAGWALR